MLPFIKGKIRIGSAKRGGWSLIRGGRSVEDFLYEFDRENGRPFYFVVGD